MPKAPTPSSTPVTYADAGVDIDRANRTKQRIKYLAHKTFIRGVLSEIGGFGGLFAVDKVKNADPVLVSSVAGAERAADGIAAQRQHQAGGFAPPRAKVNRAKKTAGGIGELALVNDEAGIVCAGQNLGNDAVEGNGNRLDFRVEDFEREIGRGQQPGTATRMRPRSFTSSMRLATTIGP